MGIEYDNTNDFYPADGLILHYSLLEIEYKISNRVL